MTGDERYTAVIDRFEGRRAVLLLEEDEGVVDELVVSEWRLPEDARHPDAVLSVRVRDGEFVTADYDPEETERRTSDAQSRFDRLARRPGESEASDSEAESEDDAESDDTIESDDDASTESDGEDDAES